MKKTLIFGNSGSGKSTLAKRLCSEHGLAHLDLDTLAWEPGTPPVRANLEDSRRAIDAFLAEHAGWVIEGCYADLMELVLPASNELVFMDLPLDACIANARARPWEPHKYETQAAQDANLPMLIEWIQQYEARDDTFSRAAHRALYEGYTGKKRRVTRNKAFE